ncbi:hypothetical protein QTP88_021546 [Uroleucon formosanum]
MPPNGDLQAPSYVELHKTIKELQKKIKQLESEVASSRDESQVSATTSVVNTPRADVCEYRVLPDLNKSIKVFDGCEPVYEADDWIQTVEGMANLNCWPLAFRMQFVRSYITGVARSWFTGRDFKDWDDFIQKFRNTFVRQLRTADKWEAMQKRRQIFDEHIMVYFQEKARLCRGLSLSFDETRDYIIQGIYHKELAMHVLDKNHSGEEGLKSDLLNWTRMNAKRTEIKHEKEQKGRPTAKASTRGGSGSGGHASGSTGKWVVKTAKPEVSDKSSADTDEMVDTDKGKCWVCRKVGHRSRDCTIKKKGKCFACGAEGHFARDCTSRPTYGILMQVRAKENQEIVIRTRQCLSAVSGKANTTILVDNVEAGPVKVLVVPDNVQRYDMIIGRNWLDLDGVTYKKEDGKLVLCKSKDEIGLGDVSVITIGNELDMLQVLTAVPGHRRIYLRTEDFKYVNTDVSIEEQTRLLSLINEYRDCFALSIEELGCTAMTVMEINETEGSAPVTGRPYKTTAADREAIAEIIGEWKRHGVVVDTDSPYASPVILVKQGDKNRLFESLRAGRYFTQLDLASGYLQVPLSEAAQEKTAFITPDDTGHFTRMPFGLAGAPGEFTRLMRKVLGSLKDRIVKNYLDDWVVDTEDWPDMLVKLRMVLDKLRVANLTLKPSKCLFGAKSIEFLGFIIGGGQIGPGTIKSQAIEQFPVPKDVHGVRRFLGLTGFFRRFVKNYATLAEPLSRLTKKNVAFEWSAVV